MQEAGSDMRRGIGRWWILIGGLVGVYLAVSTGFFLTRKSTAKAGSPNPLFENVQTDKVSVLAVDELGGVLMADGARGLRYERNWDNGMAGYGSMSSSMSTSGTPVFADGNKEGEAVIGDDHTISFFDTERRTVTWTKDLLTKPAKAPAVSTLRGCGWCGLIAEFWVQNGQKIEVWGIAKGTTPAGTMATALPPVAAFAANRNGNHLCYAETGSTEVVRMEFAGGLAWALRKDAIDLQEPVVRLAISEKGSDCYALTKSGKLYYVDAAKTLVADLKGEDEKNSWTLKQEGGVMLCFDRTTLISASLSDPLKFQKHAYVELTGAASGGQGTVVSTRKGQVATVDYVR
jgi:hypothetical protein